MQGLLKIKECKACLFLCVFFSLLLCDNETCSEPSLEIRCVRDAVRDMGLELCPGNVNEGDCRQERNFLYVSLNSKMRFEREFSTV